MLDTIGLKSCNLITVPLGIPDVKVLSVDLNERGDVIITVESTQVGTLCQHCGRKIKVPRPRSYDQHLMLQLVNSTVEDVNRKEDVGLRCFEGAIARCIQAQVNWDEFDELTTIGIDEIALTNAQIKTPPSDTLGWLIFSPSLRLCACSTQ